MIRPSSILCSGNYERGGTADDKQTFLCVSGRSQEEEGAGWQSPLTRNMEEEEGEGFVPTAKEFGKNGGKDGRDARKVLLERNTLFVFHRSLARSLARCPSLAIGCMARRRRRGFF